VNLAELLEHTAKDYLDDRVDLLDGEQDNLWSDALIVRYLNEAQRILARRAWCIIDTGVAPSGVIVLVTDKVLYPLHKSVLRVYDATPTTQSAPLGRTEDVYLRDPSPPGFDAFDVGRAASAAGLTSASGVTIALATDAGARALRVYPPPAAAQNGTRVELKVARLPTTWLTLEDMEASPEVPEDFHFSMCTYAAGKCLTQPNVDGQMKTDGRLLLAEFDAAVKEARQDRQRAEWNGGRWGFASTTAIIR
jgi:hypothetical protein